MTKAGAVGRACKLAFSYGLEFELAAAAEFLAKLTFQERHSHIPIYESKVAPRPNNIPPKSVTDAFSCMPKKSVAHNDGWTCELLTYAAQNPATTTFLRKFAELFSNEALPYTCGPTWPLSFLMYPFNKKLPEDRSLAKPTLRPVTVGFVQTRFGCRVMVKMNTVYVAENCFSPTNFHLGSTAVYNKSY